MATRSTIKIEGFTTAKIYKHWDGYPSAMEKWLEDFNQFFAEKRGNDPSYKIAQLLRWAAVHGDAYELDPSLITGWGIIDYNESASADYEYMLHTDGTVTYTTL